MFIRSRVLRAAAGLAAATLALAACTGKDAVDQSDGQFRFVQANKSGALIPPAQREKIGDISGTLLTGKHYSFAEAHGKVLLVNFWGSWCPPCRIETPQYERVYRALHGKGVDFVGIDVKEGSKSSPIAFVKANHITYPNVYDEPGQTALELGNLPLQGLPITVLIDRHQRVAGVYSGKQTPASIEPALNRLAAES